jgi:anti-anti-sigma regulatory factor
MLSPVYRPPSHVDGENIASFREAVAASAARYGFVVIDCSGVARMGTSAMRVLVKCSRSAHIRLVNPNPGVRLMATAFGIEVELPAER